MAVVTVGEQMKKIRIQKGMTQKQVADACGMADSAIRKYESGIMRPKSLTVSRIAKALGVEPLELTSHDPNYPITFTVPIDELPNAIHRVFNGNTEQKSLIPVSEESESVPVFFPERLKEAMGEMTCEELAQKIDGNANVISLYLDGKRKPYKVTSHLMAIYLGVNPEWLHDRNAPKYKKPVPMDRDGLSETERQIMKCVRQMSDREQETFLAWLQASQGHG